MKFRWKRWALGGAGLLAAYAAVGFGLVPLIVRNQVPKLAAGLERRADIGEVKFNPFSLRLEAHDVRLTEQGGAPIAGVAALVVDLDWNSLWRRAWSFAEIRITAPSASLTVTPDGKSNLADLLASIEKKQQPRDPSVSGKLPRLVVESLVLEQGKVEVRDQQAGYANTVTPIDVALEKFSTLPDHTGPYSFSADSARGGKVRWKGEASVNPISGSGELVLENGSLPELAVYLKSYAKVAVAAGRLAMVLPYRFSYIGGKLEASVNGGKIALTDLAMSREGNKDSFATLTRMAISGINADLARRDATVGEVSVAGGTLSIRRDSKGEIDLVNLMATSPAQAATSGAAVVVRDWKLGIKQVAFSDVTLGMVDETVTPPLQVAADKLQLHLHLAAEQKGALTQVTVGDAKFSLSNLALTSGGQALLKVGQVGFDDGMVDLAARRASVGRAYVDGGQVKLQRDRAGQINLLRALPKAMAAQAGEKGSPAQPAAEPWNVVVKLAELGKFAADVEDQGAGITLHAQDIAAKVENASNDLKQPVKFSAGLKLREGGQLSALGSVVPAGAVLQADVKVQQLALAPAQPLLAKYVRLKLAGGNLSTQGRLTMGAQAGAKASALRYAGAFNVAGLVLNEEDGDLFAAWKNVSADKLALSLAPNSLQIPELRIVEPDAKLLIENDHTFNASRLLVQPAGAASSSAKVTAPAPTAAAATADPFPVRIARVRVENGKLDFTDLSLRPQFGAKIHELNGVVTGLASNRDARAQVELDGRVDEFGLARIRGELNPFAPRDNTDVNVVFKNVDMVSASPYTMKFAGYKIAEGKISLDLKYKVRNNKLEGDNHIVIDKLTLGERVDSPDALKLPLELAIAILKDSDGRIDLGLPVSGDMSDPQFSYGSVIVKAIGSILGRIVTAPFRALAGLFGGSGGGEKLESIDFDPGSDKLLPPEREKIKQIAQVLAKRPQLKLVAPGQFSESADGAALRTRAVRVEIAARAGIKLAPGEEPGPLDIQGRAVRSAMRDLYAERFGKAELDKLKAEAERGGPAPAVAAEGKDTVQGVAGGKGEASGVAREAGKDSAPAVPDAAQARLPMWQRMGKLIQGEPEVADATAFYRKLLDRLNQNQTLPADALGQLGTRRAAVVVAALAEAGVDATRLSAGAPEKVASEPGKLVPLKLGLAAK